METNKRHCPKCNKDLSERTEFYTYKDGRKFEICKKCLTLHVRNDDPKTYLWILEKFDVPYVPQVWESIYQHIDPAKMTSLSVLGRYLSQMRTKQYLDKGWADSDALQQERQAREAESAAALADFKEKAEADFESGKISEAEFNCYAETWAPPPEPVAETPVSPFISEDALAQHIELTQEEIIHLATKWGRLYTPEQWLRLEQNEAEMRESFDINDADTANTVKMICKTYLKMNEALDSGDHANFNALQRSYDAMRKSTKLTAVQNKKESEDFVSSIGEIVRYCEEKGGRIPRIDLSIERDEIDTIINDMKGYYKSLVYEDASLSHRIEQYIKNREIADRRKRDKEKSVTIDTKAIQNNLRKLRIDKDVER